MRCSTIAATLLLLLGAPAIGQDIEGVPRGRAFGLARTAGGAPWADAEICFLSRAWAFWSEDDDSSDLVVTRTDARGRFGAQLQYGRSYRCWARAALDDGRVLFSTEVEAVQAGERLELVGGAEPTGPTTVRLEGLGDLGPRRIRALESRLANRELRVEHAGDGMIELPPIPTRFWQLLVLEADGRPFLDVRLPADGEPHVVGAGRASWHRVRVFDVDAEKPIPGAQIVWNQQGRTVELARTGADGTAALDLSFLSATVDGTLQQQGAMQQAVIADGWHLGMLQIDDPGRGRASREALDADDQIDAECRPKRVGATGLNGQLLLGGEPAADWPLIVTATAWHRDDATSSTGNGRVLLVRTDPDGVFRLDGLSDGDEPFDLVIGARQLEALPVAWRRGLQQRISLPLPQGGGAPVPIDLLADLRVVDVQVTAHGDGLPVAHAKVHYGSGAQGGLTDVRTDRVGRARLLIHAKSDEPLFVTARGDGDRGWTAVEASRARLAAAPADQPTVIPLELRATARVQGKLVRPDGVAEDVRVWIYPSVLRSQLAQARSTVPDDAVFQVLAPEAVPASLVGSLTEGSSVVGDSFEIQVPELPATWMLKAWLGLPGSNFTGRAQFETGPGGVTSGIELELRRQ